MSQARDKAAVNRGYKLLPREIRVPGDTENRGDIRRRDISENPHNNLETTTYQSNYSRKDEHKCGGGRKCSSGKDRVCRHKFVEEECEDQLHHMSPANISSH